jgi:hypothetical protein
MKKLANLITLEKSFTSKKSEIQTKFEEKTQKYIQKSQATLKSLQRDLADKDTLIQQKISEQNNETLVSPKEIPQLDSQLIQKQILQQLQ